MDISKIEKEVSLSLKRLSISDRNVTLTMLDKRNLAITYEGRNTKRVVNNILTELDYLQSFGWYCWLDDIIDNIAVIVVEKG